jgi:hypothetical protein
VTLDAGEGYDSYLWSNGETTQSIEVSESGDYSVEVANGGVNNYSMSFDGENDYAVLSSTPDFDDLGDFSFMFWMYTVDGLNRQEILSKDTDPQPNGDWSSFVENNKFVFELRHGNISNYSISTNDFLPNQSWTNIAITRESTFGEIKLYMNGQLQNSSFSSTGHILNSQDIHIGKHAVINNDLFYEGKIDGLSFWAEVLDSSHIQNYMNCAPNGNEEGLVGYWNFEEGTGTTAYDQTSNGNDGTINGATWSSETPEQSCSFCSSSDSITVTISPSDRKSTRLNSSHDDLSRMPSSA